MLAGLWILVSRLGGKWWAVFAVWAIALNPATIKTYSLAISQGLVACMLVWTIVFVLGERRSMGQIAFGAMLSGALLMTRMNMAPVLPFVILFIFWRYGYRMSILATITGLLPVILFHTLYWPGIIRLWADWFPQKTTPFLDSWRYIDVGSPVWINSLPLSDRWWSFLQGLKTNFLALVGLIGFSPIWLLANQWKTKFYQQAAAFLSVMLLILVLLHGWASLALNSCVYCFEGYLEFFSPIGLALIPVIYRGWRGEEKGWFKWFTSAIMIVGLMSVGYGSYQQTGPTLMNLPVLRVKEGRILSGTAPIWSILEGAFGIESKLSKWILPTLAGLALGSIILLLVWLVYRAKGFQRKVIIGKGLLILTILFVIGLVLSPTVVLAGANFDRDCFGDVIASYENVGVYLANVIPPGHSVYWEGGLSVVPLLYLPDIEIYPAQINDGYSFRTGGNTEELLRYGLWNFESQSRWLSEADFIIVEDVRYGDSIKFWKGVLNPDQFHELDKSPSYLPCRESRLRVFRRIGP
jgi:hypothetical protein